MSKQTRTEQTSGARRIEQTPVKLYKVSEHVGRARQGDDAGGRFKQQSCQGSKESAAHLRQKEQKASAEAALQLHFERRSRVQPQDSWLPSVHLQRSEEVAPQRRRLVAGAPASALDVPHPAASVRPHGAPPGE